MATSSLLSPEETAQELGVSIQTAYRLFQARVFPVVFIGRLRKVRRSNLNAWLEQETRRAQPVETARTRRAEARA